MSPAPITGTVKRTLAAAHNPMTLVPEKALALIQAGASSNNNNNNNNTANVATPSTAATVAASTTAPAQPQGPSLSMPNANNMLVNGRGNATSTSRASSGRTANNASASSSSMQQLPRPSSTARGNVAAFLTKLYKYAFTIPLVWSIASSLYQLNPRFTFTYPCHIFCNGRNFYYNQS